VYAPPPVVVQEPTVVTTPAYNQDTFTVNVPNNNGSYTPIVIRRSGSGYVGPQGEYYPTFPSVSQLKSMYVK
jgi:hypothetical protein